MSQTPPPGWYRDPGHPAAEPARERWWDGAAWTARTRPAEGEAPPRTPTVPSVSAGPGGPSHSLPTLPGKSPPALASPVDPDAPNDPDDPTGRGRRRDLAVVGFGLLALGLTGALVAALLLGDGGSRTALPVPDDGSRPPTSEGVPDGADGGGDGDREGSAGGPLTEGRVDGVALPVPEGWSERPGDGTVSLARGGYPCPADASLDCLAGAATLHAVPGAGTLSTEGAARSDVVAFQRDAYPASAYGGIFGTEELAAEAVLVAGRSGYRVRVGLTTPFSSAVVESVAFASPRDPSTLLLLRLSWDDVDGADGEGDGGGDEGEGNGDGGGGVEDAPPLSDLELILDGATTDSDGPGTAA